jgi:glucose/arabinose dehydrogenase
LLFHWTTRADDAPQTPNRQAFGIAKRVPWTTSKVKGSPDSPTPYRIEPAFPSLPKFFEPLDMAAAPGSNRLFVAERKGKLFSFVNDPKVAKADLLLDIKKTVYGFTFHPQFPKNRYVYVTYVLDPDKPDPKGSRISRFEVKGDDPPRCNPASEKVIFEWLSGGHNGGCLKFGPDGYLYIGTGDGSGIADEHQTGQDISDVLASILRIDVDHPQGNKAYSIPKDNPFIDRKDARPEVWAYGTRQPWKMSFDRNTGDLWAGEVGQDLWESVLRIERGGNYGWSINEGTHPFRPERKRGPTPILPPVVEHPHSDFRCLIGGYVYRGTKLKDLAGTYLYGDYDTGKVWGLRYDGKKVIWQQELARTRLRLVSFGEDNANEMSHSDYPSSSWLYFKQHAA